MPVRVSCPYCNSAFSLGAVPPGGRVTCPRCGDAFAVRDSDAEAGAGRDEAAVESRSLEPPQAREPNSKSRTLAVALTLAILAIGIGAGFLYYQNRSGPDSPPVDPLASVTPPLSLSGLGFLPPDANLVLAIQPGPVVGYCERTGQDPRALLAQAGVPASVFATLERAGIRLEQIGHIALGARIPDEAHIGHLRLVVAIVLRSPLADEEAFLKAIEAKRVEYRGKTRYDVVVGRQVPLKLVRASETVWVFGWADEDLAPAFGEAPPAQLPAELQGSIRQRIPEDAAAWVVTASESWAKKEMVQSLVTLGVLKAAALAKLAQGRALAAGLSLAESPRLRVSVRCADPETGEKLRGYFQERLTSEGTIVSGEQEWATFESPVDPGAGFGPVKNLLADLR
jgi:hypothetical protein